MKIILRIITGLTSLRGAQRRSNPSIWLQLSGLLRRCAPRNDKYFALLIACCSMTAYAFDIRDGHVVLQAGAVSVTQGEAQNVGIQSLVGNRYTLSDNHATNYLVGAGYLFDAPINQRVEFKYGLNAFYFAATSVSGTVIQEQLFSNLSYHYRISYLPIYATVKTLFHTLYPRLLITLDAGVGPNIIQTSNYYESSLNGGATIPDNAFTGQSQTTLSGTAGINVRVNNVFAQLPLECGYRFFYLGSSSLARNNSQWQNNLSTGTSYANALICTLEV